MHVYTFIYIPVCKIQFFTVHF